MESPSSRTHIQREYLPVSEKLASRPSLKIMSYNVLESFSSTKFNFPYASFVSLNAAQRREKVVAEIAASDPDIICLQEVDYFPQFYEPKLKALGYGLIFKKKTNAFFEGIMLGYKLDRLQQEAVETIEYDQLKPVAGNFKRGNVAIIAELRLVEEKQRVLVANTHLFYEPAAHDIRFAQISYLLSKVEQLEREKATDATFICGDLNAAPGSPAISRAYGQDPVLTNETPEVVRNVEHFAAEYPHKLKLKSAYEDYQYRINKTQTHETGGLDGKLKGHPEYTCYGNDGPEMLDYIFCSEAVSVCQVLRLAGKDLVQKENGGLPSSMFPSDHLRIEAVVQL